jgi:hypothetical protein
MLFREAIACYSENIRNPVIQSVGKMELIFKIENGRYILQLVVQEKYVTN